MRRLLLSAGIAVLAVACSPTDTGTEATTLAPPTTIAALTTLAPTTTATSTTTPVAPTTTTTTTAAPEPDEADLPPILVASESTLSHEEWLAAAAALAPSLVRPSDCGSPLDEPESLPNSDRSYRGGVHKGVDFICEEYGRFAIAALPGQILIANNTFVDPSPEERASVLQTAQDLGHTPPWTLAMLYGRFVVVDHGIVDGVGHVVSLYAHLNEVDESIRPGLRVDAGTVLGEIGNRGTATAASNGDRTRSIHLHWDLYVDNGFFGQGLTAAETSEVYTVLLGEDG